MSSKSFERKLIISLLILLINASCKKDEGTIERQLVVTKYDRSINTEYDIVTFDICSENDIFAIGYNGWEIKLFVSETGGTSWNEIPSPFSNWNQNVGVVQAAIYMDKNNLAFIINNKMYRSYNAGNSWSVTTDGFQEIPIFCAGKSTDGNLLFMTNFEVEQNRIYKSAYNSPYSSIIDYTPVTHSEFEVGRLYKDYFVFLDYDEDYFVEKIHGYNLLTYQYDTIAMNSTAYEFPVDAMKVDNRFFLIRKDGKLSFMSDQGAYSDYSAYNYHNRDYYSGEYMGSYFIAVGDRTISTNINGIWEEALNTDISGQKELFRKVKKIDNDYFYVSGNAGLFFKATFK